MIDSVIMKSLVVILMVSMSSVAFGNFTVEQINQAEQIAVKDYQEKMKSKRSMGFKVWSMSSNKLLFAIQTKAAGQRKGFACHFLIGIEKDINQNLLVVNLNSSEGRQGLQVNFPYTQTRMTRNSNYLRNCAN